MLILNHIVPAVPTNYLNAYFLKGTKKVYDGDIVIGQDGMFISLPAGSDAINVISID